MCPSLAPIAGGTTIITEAATLRLLQLASASLPVGGYAFSQGLEYAVEAGWVNDQHSAGDWLQTQIEHGLANTDLPILRQLYRPACLWRASAEINELNALSLACRETAELRLGEQAMGEALMRLLGPLEPELQAYLQGPCQLGRAPSFVVVFALAARHWQLDEDSAALGLGWSWLENQVAAATKLIPLGQTQAQLLLSELQRHLQTGVAASARRQRADIGASLPALAIASALHETQYSRLFRS
ncbi:MAG: urease accessory protein UreF [Cellvibrionaceae bacterium]|nr:urease accessory protein UreF [Cellvibrionaceae bacterium]